MAFTDYDRYDGVGLAALVKSKQVSAREVLDEAIRRAEAINPKLNFLAHKAYAVARRIAEDPKLPDERLKGVPWLLKELATGWEGQPHTNYCPYFKDVMAPFDAETLRRIKAAGMIPLGKATSPEQGWALSTESSMHGVTRSSWDLVGTRRTRHFDLMSGSHRAHPYGIRYFRSAVVERGSTVR